MSTPRRRPERAGRGKGLSTARTGDVTLDWEEAEGVWTDNGGREGPEGKEKCQGCRGTAGDAEWGRSAGEHGRDREGAGAVRTERARTPRGLFSHGQQATA